MSAHSLGATLRYVILISDSAVSDFFTQLQTLAPAAAPLTMLVCSRGLCHSRAASLLEQMIALSPPSDFLTTGDLDSRPHSSTVESAPSDAGSLASTALGSHSLAHL